MTEKERLNPDLINQSRAIRIAKGSGKQVKDVQDLVNQAIDISIGWNIISTYIDPEDTDMASVFSGIVNDLIIVKDEAGSVYWPMFGLNSIGSLTKGKGYQ